MSVDNAAPCRGVVVEPLAHVGIIPALGGSRVVGGDGVGASVVTLVGGLGVNLFRLLLEHGEGEWLGLNLAAFADRAVPPLHGDPAPLDNICEPLAQPPHP